MPRRDLRGGAKAVAIRPLTALAAVVFAFDGTIVESVATKTEAFRTLFAAYPHHLNQIVALDLEHGGRSRHEKFSMIYRDVLRQEPQPGEFAELGGQVEALVCDAVVAALFVPGDALSHYRAAAMLNIPFIGRVALDDRSVFPPNVPTIPDLTRLDTAIGAR
jgi:hypothetical protein